MNVAILFVLLLVWSAIVAVVAVLIARRGEAPTDDAGASGRRSFQYFLLLVLLLMTAFGVSQLLAIALPGEETFAGTDPTELSTPLALVVIGFPSYLLLGWWIRKNAVDDDAMRAAAGWSAYVNGALVISLLVTMGAAIVTLTWIVGVADYTPFAVSLLLVFGIVWIGHWMVGHRSLRPPRTQPHLAIGSVAGLLAMSISAGATLGIALTELYARAFSDVISTDFSEAIRVAVVFLVVGTVVWIWHWLVHYGRYERTEVWNAYVLLLGVLGGLVVAISSAGGALFGVLQWFFGEPAASSAAEHFEFMPGVLAAGLTAGAVWWYHRAVLRSGGGEERSEVDRVYQYLLSGLGLATTLVGVTTVVVALIGALTPDPLAGSDDVDVLLAALTALLIGTPIWWATWSSIQRMAAADPENELSSPSRNLYLLILFGLGGLIALGSLVAVMVIAFGAALDGTFGGETVYEMRLPIALLVTVGLVAGYHWRIWRQDRERLPDEKRPRKKPTRDVVLLAPDSIDTSGIAEATGANVRVMRRLDDAPVDVPAVIEAINASDADRIVVVTAADGVRVIPVGGLRR
jgi:Domain of unknown function (DUF5671)